MIYHSINSPEVNNNESSALLDRIDFHVQNKNKALIIWMITFLATFTFYGYCIYHTFAPKDYLENMVSHHRYLVDNEEIVECTKDVSIGTTVGAIAGVALVGGAFLLIGLSPLGPIAGGWFAANMGAGLASGSVMATLQGAAMTGGAYATGTGLGAAAGATTAAYSYCTPNN